MEASGSNAASTACFNLAASSSAGSGSPGSTSPIGQGCDEGSGRALFTCTGVKYTVFRPAGRVTHPWLPRYCAVRVTPFGIVTCTVFAARSITGFPTLARSR